MEIMCPLMFLLFVGTFIYLVYRNATVVKPPCPKCGAFNSLYVCGNFVCRQCANQYKAIA